MATARVTKYGPDGTIVSDKTVEVPDAELTAEDRIGALEAEVRGIKAAAASQAALASPTAKGVADAVAKAQPKAG